MTRSSLLLIGAGLMVALCGYAAFAVHEVSGESSSEPPPTGSEPVGRRSGGLPARAADAAHHPRLFTPASAESTSVDLDDTPQQSASDEPLEASVESEHEQFYRTLTEAVASEARDGRWAARAEGQIHDAIIAIEGIEVEVDVDCRSTLCALNVETHTVAYRDEMLERLPSIVPWPSQGYFKFETKESTAGTIFVAREGEELR